MSGRHHDLYRLIRAFSLIEVTQLLPQPKYLYPNDGIGGRIEGLRAAKHIRRDRILLDGIDAAFKMSFADVFEEASHPWLALEYPRCQHSVERGPFPGHALRVNVPMIRVRRMRNRSLSCHNWKALHYATVAGVQPGPSCSTAPFSSISARFQGFPPSRPKCSAKYQTSQTTM